MFAKEDVVLTFVFQERLYVVTKQGQIWRFEDYNGWMRVAYLPPA